MFQTKQTKQYELTLLLQTKHTIHYELTLLLQTKQTIHYELTQLLLKQNKQTQKQVQQNRTFAGTQI